MDNMDHQRRAALLEATLREILRIDREADKSSEGSMGFDLALDDQLLQDWHLIKARAEGLLKVP